MLPGLLTHTFWLAAQPEGGGAGDVASLALLIGFCAGFVVLAFLFLRKKRKERLDILAQASEEAAHQHNLDERALGTGDGETVPKADELVAAQREAAQKQADMERAARERKRIEAEAQKDEDAAVQERLAAARQKEEQAKQDADEAKARAKQLNAALKKTRDGLVGRIGKALAGKTIDEGILDELEAVLFTSDVGARTAERLLEAVKSKLKAGELSDVAKVQAALKAEIVDILDGPSHGPANLDGDGLRVVMIVGVNGAGKTTSIGKLTHRLKGQGKTVLLGAGDTFRAAATEQLEIWAERNECPIVKGAEGADPASVLYDAVTAAQSQNVDVVLCDTAGRLHTKVNLMEELSKVHRVLGKAQEGAPHEVWLVLDATVGQNAIQQAKQFSEAVPVTGIVLTKLDGTAKGGVVIGLCAEMNIPVRYIGVGEQLSDLRPFSAAGFADALFGADIVEKSAA